MKEFDNINSKINSAGKSTPFTVPDGYFDSLPNRIQERCLLETQSKNAKSYSLIRVVRGQLAFAAGFIGLAMLAYTGYYFIHQSGNNSKQIKEDYIEIVQRSIYEFDQEVSRKPTKSLLNYDSLLNNHREEVIKYLFEEDIDYVTLMERY